VSTPAELRAAGITPGAAVAAVPVAGVGVACAWEGGSCFVSGSDPQSLLRDIAELQPRWVWWRAREFAAGLLDAGVRVSQCWDLGAVGRLLHGTARDDAEATWAALHDLAPPATAAGEPSLLDYDESGDDAVRADGQLSRTWLREGVDRDAGAAQRWADLTLLAQQRQRQLLDQLPDPRPVTTATPLAVLTAHSESAAALLAVELGRVGLPVDRVAMSELLTPVIGSPAVDAAHEEARRRQRDHAVRRLFPQSDDVDLRNPAHVRDMLGRVGLLLPDTRSWRLEPHAATFPAVAALLSWRKAERLATTYGWSWLARLGDDGRLRGEWTAAEGAGRMTASAGLHNLPAELREGVRAEPGHVFVRADLGQVEPRVLAVVSGDRALAEAAADDDMYAPVAARLGCDRPTAKVAVLAAMYGQTSGTAGNALRQMQRSYPTALAYLRDAEETGRIGGTLRTYGGRLLRPAPGWGRFARNAVVQGAAAELFKAWAATVRARLPEGAQIVMCLHDELLVHAPQDHGADVALVLEQALSSTASWWAAGSGVRFVAEVSAGASWAQTH
jgi:DNA polymerase-1